MDLAVVGIVAGFLRKSQQGPSWDNVAHTLEALSMGASKSVLSALTAYSERVLQPPNVEFYGIEDPSVEALTDGFNIAVTINMCVRLFWRLERD